MTLLSFKALAIIWEVARRYNTTYRVPTPPTHRWVFENPDCWNEEALWLAHDVIRDVSRRNPHQLTWQWSDLSQKWLPDLQDRKPAGSPIRHGLRTEEERGILSWMNGVSSPSRLPLLNDQNFVRTVYKCVRYLILISGDLCDHVDIDPNFVMRRYYIKRGESIPARFEYKPLQKPQFEIVIGPTNLPADSGGCAISNQEGDEIQPPDELTMKDIEDWGYEIFLEEKAVSHLFASTYSAVI